MCLVSINHLYLQYLGYKMQEYTMPTVLRLQGFRFFFYLSEGNPLEPAHIHILYI